MMRVGPDLRKASSVNVSTRNVVGLESEVTRVRMLGHALASCSTFHEGCISHKGHFARDERQLERKVVRRQKCPRRRRWWAPAGG